MKIALHISLLIILVSSCRKENCIKEQYDILSSPYLTEITDSFPDWAIRNDSVLINQIFSVYEEDLPSFIPNDSREFCFSQRDSTSKNWNIKTFNLETGEKRSIYNTSRSRSLDIEWGRSNKIVVWESNATSTFTMNPDGSDIKDILSDMVLGYPLWSADGKYLYATQSRTLPLIDTSVYFVKIDGETLEIIDSLDHAKVLASFASNENAIYFYGGINSIGYIVKSNLDNYKLEPIISNQIISNNQLSVQNTFYPSPYGKYIYFTSNTGDRQKRGMYRINTRTKELSRYKQGNVTMDYEYLSFSADGRFMLCRKTYFNLKWPSGSFMANQYIKSYIHLIDLQTDKEYRVEVNP